MLISLVSCSLPSFALFSLCDEALWITGDEPNMLEFEYNIQYNNTIQYRYSKLLPTYLDWYISSQCVGDDRHSNCRILKCQRSQTITSLLWRSTSKSGSNIWINVFYYLLIRWLYLCLWNEKNVLIVLSNVFFCWRSKPNDIHFTIMFDPKSRKFSPLDVWFFFFSIKKILKQIHCWNKKEMLSCVYLVNTVKPELVETKTEPKGGRILYICQVAKTMTSNKCLQCCVSGWNM